jgi:hypothetical protein
VGSSGIHVVGLDERGAGDAERREPQAQPFEASSFTFSIRSWRLRSISPRVEIHPHQHAVALFRGFGVSSA